ncbi:hypothetical protein BCR33DRAFT_857131 [Rhizoclosmatium globosum]|uniref:Uncharacterized protein n=1 Tax=Rhizoclosmatium globosum TaxID=329046 RepID=A0A1Y2B8L0_9FUNG|nr:hypothetical protein BCR33DRAFT_857131 [Rhizoclosmatium globosum]|eukprot:ORY31178.1 hypothetical protein BCR33DRAFT_857131 [Rhizoclosmatium globosum]
MQFVVLAVLAATLVACLPQAVAPAVKPVAPVSCKPVSSISSCIIRSGAGVNYQSDSRSKSAQAIQINTINGKGPSSEASYLQVIGGSYSSEINRKANKNYPAYYFKEEFGTAGGLNGIVEFYAIKSASYDVVIGVKNINIEYITFYCKNAGVTTGVSTQFKSFSDANEMKKLSCGPNTATFKSFITSNVNIAIGTEIGIKSPSAVTGGLCLLQQTRCDQEVFHVQQAPKPINFIQTIKACPKSNRITYPCKILANPWITPAVVDMKTMKQRPNFSFRFPGLYHAFLAADFEVTIDVDQVLNKDAPLRVGMTPEEKKQIQSNDGMKEVFSVTKVYVRCGRNIPAEKIHETDPFNFVLDAKQNKVPNPKLNQFAKTNPKVQVIDINSAAQSISCGGYTINTELSYENNIRHISISSIYYPGWYAYGGLCLNYDLTVNNEFDDTWATDCPGFVTDPKEAPKKQNFFHHANSEEMKCWDKVPVGAPLAAYDEATYTCKEAGPGYNFEINRFL